MPASTSIFPSPVTRPAGPVPAESRLPSERRRMISTLQLGLGWFPEHPGGLDRYFFELLNALPAAGVSCRGLLAGSGAAAAATNGRVRAFASESDSLPRRLWAVRAAVSRAVAEQPIDLLVSHFALHSVAAGAGHVPSVVHFHGPWADESRAEGGGRAGCWVKARIERLVYRRARRVICLSSPFADILIRTYGILPERTRVIPGGVDCARFDIPESRAEARSKLDWPSDRPIVFCIRRLVKRMGLANLIEAAGLIRREAPDALVLIAGRGPLSTELQERIAAAGLSSNVRLLGYLSDPDLALAYRAADVTVVPSTALEGFGLVAAESLAAGTPAIVTPVGGLPEVVEGLGSQWVLPGVSAREIADALAAFIRGKMPANSSDACTAHARSHFDWPIIASRVADVYAEALTEPRHRD